MHCGIPGNVSTRTTGVVLTPVRTLRQPGEQAGGQDTVRHEPFALAVEIRRPGIAHRHPNGERRLVGSGWDLRGWIWLDISRDGGRSWSFAAGTYLSDGTGYAHTSGWLTQADQNYVFRAS